MIQQLAGNGGGNVSLLNAISGDAETGNGSAGVSGAELPSAAANSDFSSESVAVTGQSGQVSPLAGVNIDQIRDALEAYRAANPGQGAPGAGRFVWRRSGSGGFGGGGFGGASVEDLVVPVAAEDAAELWRREDAISEASIPRSRMALCSGWAAIRLWMRSLFTAWPAAIAAGLRYQQIWSHADDCAVHSALHQAQRKRHGVHYRFQDRAVRNYMINTRLCRPMRNGWAIFPPRDCRDL